MADAGLVVTQSCSLCKCLSSSYLLQLLLERGQLSAQLRGLDLGLAQLLLRGLPRSNCARWEVPAHTDT